MKILSQVNAVLTSEKTRISKEVTDLHQICKKDVLFNGRVRVYRPLDPLKGGSLPPESQKVQYQVGSVLTKITEALNRLWSLTLTQDTGNREASANIEVHLPGEPSSTLMAEVPVTTLLFLDKQLDNLETIVEALPTPDAGEDWVFDKSQNLLRGRLTETQKTAKEPTVIVKYEATDKHPAQTELFTKDVPVGIWEQTLLSGAMQVDTKEKLLQRVRLLQAAVKAAKEKANQCPVERQTVSPLFKFLFEGLEIPGFTRPG